MKPLVEFRRARKNLFVSALCITVARRERSTKQEICALGAASPWTGRGVIVEDWIGIMKQYNKGNDRNKGFQGRNGRSDRRRDIRDTPLNRMEETILATMRSEEIHDWSPPESFSSRPNPHLQRCGHPTPRRAKRWNSYRSSSFCRARCLCRADAAPNRSAHGSP